jgi:hypothetical protein
MTDVLGVMEAWDDEVTVVRTDEGPVTIAIADIVAGKPVPPRPGQPGERGRNPRTGRR